MANSLSLSTLRWRRASTARSERVRLTRNLIGTIRELHQTGYEPDQTGYEPKQVTSPNRLRAPKKLETRLADRTLDLPVKCIKRLMKITSRMCILPFCHFQGQSADCEALLPDYVSSHILDWVRSEGPRTSSGGQWACLEGMFCSSFPSP